MKRSVVWQIIIMASAYAAVIVVVADLVTPFRAVIAFWFLLICPGMAFVGLLGLSDRLTELILAIALSLTLDTIVAMAMVYAGVWSPIGGLLALAGQSTVGVVLQVVASYRIKPMRAP